MLNRSEILHNLEQQHAEEVARIREFQGRFVGPTIDIMVQEKGNRAFAIEGFLSGLLHSPQAIYFRGKTFADFQNIFRQQLGQGLYEKGIYQLGQWLEQNWKGDLQNWTTARIIERNTQHFVEMWYGGKTPMPAPDWDALQQSHDMVMDGHAENIYPLYVQLVNGLQTSAVELMLEDAAPPDEVLNRFLLQ